ncbi:NUDIX hydrolase [Streptomyces sp. NPDC045369]|uniref:NUDIX hydrolase n=1 Tax=Streptomyces sp. NPDC045369 TaxID=3155732 RepID=UPI00340B1C5B
MRTGRRWSETRSATAVGSDVQDPFGCEPAILIAAGEPLTRQFLQCSGRKPANLPASPGGHMDGGETSPAATRELQEETGVTVPATDLAQRGAYDAIGRDPRGRYITVTYTATLPSPIANSHESNLRFCKPCSGHLALTAPHGPTYTHVKGPAVRTPR